MKYFFDNCNDAIKNAVESRQFGVHYSDKVSESTDIHTHNSCELLFCISGGSNFLISDKLYSVSDGDLFVINQYEAHKITYDHSAKIARFVIELSPEFLQQISTPDTNLSACFYSRTPDISHRIPLSPENRKKMYNLFSEIRKNDGYASDVLNYSALIRILVMANQLFKEQNMHEHAQAYENKTMQIAIEYINLHYYKTDSTLSLNDLSKQAFVSPNQLCRIFKFYTGTTISKYILSKRISEAKKLLSRGCSVSDAAEQCGFGNYANFIRAFKRNVGVSPGKYSEKNHD